MLDGVFGIWEDREVISMCSVCLTVCQSYYISSVRARVYVCVCLSACLCDVSLSVCHLYVGGHNRNLKKSGKRGTQVN